MRHFIPVQGLNSLGTGLALAISTVEEVVGADKVGVPGLTAGTPHGTPPGRSSIRTAVLLVQHVTYRM